VLGQSWSLGYEAQFYVVVAFLLFVSRRRAFEQWFFGWTLGIGAAAFAVTLGSAALRRHVDGSLLNGSWLLFLAGILVYYVTNCGDLPRRVAAISALVLGASFARGHGGTPLALASAFGLILIVLYRWDAPVARSPFTRPLRALGLMSYSLYLVHWPIAKAVITTANHIGAVSSTARFLAIAPCTIVLSLSVAALFHRHVERRFMSAAASSWPIRYGATAVATPPVESVAAAAAEVRAACVVEHVRSGAAVASIRRRDFSRVCD
jgi:peptidoglycan/LPS O-acetylase OafA/YrhL